MLQRRRHASGDTRVARGRGGARARRGRRRLRRSGNARDARSAVRAGHARRPATEWRAVGGADDGRRGDDCGVRLSPGRRRRGHTRCARGARRRARRGAGGRARVGGHRSLGRGGDGALGRALARPVAPHVSERRPGRIAPAPERARDGRRLEHGIGLRGLGPLALARRARIFRRARTAAGAALPAPHGPDARRLHAGARTPVREATHPPPEALRLTSCERTTLDGPASHEACVSARRSASARSVRAASRLPVPQPAAPDRLVPATTPRRDMTPKVTLLLAVHNGEPYIGEAVQSVLDQTFTDFELLVVDDASTDETVGIVERLGDGRVRILRNEHNVGQVPALNRGLLEARGEYVARLDADDACLPTRLARQVEVLDAEPRVALVGTWMDAVDDRGRLIGRLQKTLDDYVDFLYHTLIMRVYVSHPSAMYRREPVVRLGCYDEATGPAEDKDLWRKLALERFEARIVPEALVRYRLHDLQLS